MDVIGVKIYLGLGPLMDVPLDDQNKNHVGTRNTNTNKYIYFFRSSMMLLCQNILTFLLSDRVGIKFENSNWWS